jgi:ActR/RegA family two-component response regulator
MADKAHILFVDDEEGVRVTLSMMLESHGFKVTSAATVAEALGLIAWSKFDLLIADLNIGQPGDGFTVVSAMRRTHPETVTFILTGYPAFETALEAIRQQVDDYLVKPTDIEELVTTINSKLTNRKSSIREVERKRLPDLVEANRDWILRQWLQAVEEDKELASISLPEAERKDHVPRLLERAVTKARGKAANQADSSPSKLHGQARYAQGYTMAMLVREARILQKVLSELVGRNLLAIEISYLITDMSRMNDSILAELEESCHSFEQQKKARPPKR